MFWVFNKGVVFISYWPAWFPTWFSHWCTPGSEASMHNWRHHLDGAGVAVCAARSVPTQVDSRRGSSAARYGHVDDVFATKTTRAGGYGCDTGIFTRRPERKFVFLVRYLVARELVNCVRQTTPQGEILMEKHLQRVNISWLSTAWY